MDEYEIDNLIFETNEFLIKLNKIRECKKMTCSLAKTLESVLNSIEDILDNEPTLIESDLDKNLNALNLIENSIKRKFLCEVCLDYVPDNFRSLHTHINSSKHTYMLKKKKNADLLQFPSEIRYCFSDVDLSKQDYKLQYIYDEILPVESDKKLNEAKLSEFLASFRPLIAKKFVVNYVHLFGSRLYCISKPYSDFNIIFDIKDTAIPTSVLHDSSSLAHTVSDIISNETKFKVVGMSKNHPISLLQIKDVDQKLIFTLAFSNGLIRIHQGLLIKYLFQNSLHRRVCNGIIKIAQKEQFEITSYKYVLLLLHYYQAKNILPPICYLQRTCPPINCGVWQVNFEYKPLYVYCEKNNLIDNYQNFISNLVDFFKFYAQFDFKNNIISPYLGCTIPKTEFNEIMAKVPSYHAFITQNPMATNSFKVNDSGGNIQDPIELSTNVKITEAVLKKFQLFCSRVLETNIISFN